MTDISQHNSEIKNNLLCWNNKSVLRKIYADYYHLIRSCISDDNKGKIIEIGSGIGSINKVIPECLRTDMFPNPWIDIVEDAYNLAHKDNSVSYIILFDVFHHLQFPGKALEEFRRVLGRKGRVVIFEPYISLLGFLVFGFFHKEPVHWFRPIDWNKGDENLSETDNYYAAQGNATRAFFSKGQYQKHLVNWNILQKRRFSGFSYILSGGYSRPQLYPDNALSIIKKIDIILNFIPSIFAIRSLIVLEKR